MAEKLRNFEKWQQSLRNFEWLHEEVSGAMDIDVLIERKGHFLVIEGKPYFNGVRMPYGQHRALYHLSRQPNTRVYLVGEGEGDTLHVVHYNDQPVGPEYNRGSRTMWWKPERFIPTTRSQFTLLVKSWWDDASSAE